MSHFYCYRQKDICDSHIRKSVFSAVSPNIGCSVYSFLPQKICYFHKGFFTHWVPLMSSVSWDSQWKFGHHHNSKGVTVLTIFYLGLLWRYKIFFMKPTFTNRLVFDQACFQELVPIHYLLCSWHFPYYNGTSCIQLIVVCYSCPLV
jgi:hypothetical protein